MSRVVLGSRGSPLALAQAEFVAERLRAAHPGLRVEQRIIRTSGDVFATASLPAVGGKGLFTKEIEEQLLAGTIDIAVHSLKDLPTTLPAGLMLGAVPAREDARDALISKQYRSVAELPAGARVATSSIRRRAQLLAVRPDLQIEEIRGNIETRLRKLREQQALAATLLAVAGLRRLGLWETATDLHWIPLGLDEMIPAVGQGLLGCEVREADLRSRQLLAALDDPAAHACAIAERTFLRTLGGGCQFPCAAHATVTGNELRLIGVVFDRDGLTSRRVEQIGPMGAAARLGQEAAQQVGL